jgi:hypothetical protein
VAVRLHLTATNKFCVSAAGVVGVVAVVAPLHDNAVKLGKCCRCTIARHLRLPRMVLAAARPLVEQLLTHQLGRASVHLPVSGMCCLLVGAHKVGSAVI